MEDPGARFRTAVRFFLNVTTSIASWQIRLNETLDRLKIFMIRNKVLYYHNSIIDMLYMFFYGWRLCLNLTVKFKIPTASIIAV